MFSGTAPSVWRSLAFRLTGYYAGMLLAALTAVYTISYFVVSSLACQKTDVYLSTECDECERLFRIGGLAAVQDEAASEAKAQGTMDILLRLYDRSGNVVFQTDNSHWKELGDEARQAVLEALAGRRIFASGAHRMAARTIVAPLSPERVLSITVSTRVEQQLITESMRLAMEVMLGTWLVTGLLGFWLSRWMLRGIGKVTDAAIDIAGGKFARRVPRFTAGQEINRLAEAFNVMAAHVELLLRNLKETNDNLAHELRSPVTRMRGQCELALTDPASSEALQALAADMIDASDRLLGTINTLLEISETEAHVTPLPRQPVPLHRLLKDACELFAPLAEDGGVQLELVGDADPVILGDRNKLQRLFSNLLDNAIKYTPRGGRIRVVIQMTPGVASVAVHDTGVGISEQELPLIFERFHRSASARHTLGNGLGLSLARTIAQAHHGRIEATSRLGVSSTFTVFLPRLPAPSPT